MTTVIPASTTDKSTTPAQDTSELLDRAVTADEEQRPIHLEELIPIPDDILPSSLYPNLMEAWTKIVETWKAEKIEAAKKKLVADDEKEKLSSSSLDNTNDNNVIHNDEDDEPSFRWAAFAICSKDFIPALIARFLQEGATLGLAFLVRGLVLWLNKTDAEVQGEDEWQGFVWAAAILLCQFTMLACQAFSVEKTYTGLTKIQSVVVNAVFEKTIRLRSDVLEQQKGRIITLHSSESHVLRLNPFLASVFTAIPMLLAIIISLYFIVDLPGLTAIGITIIFAGFQNAISKNMSETRKEFLQKTDKRLKKFSELIAGIKLVKLMSWTPFFEKRITDLRAEETVGLTRLYVLRSLIITLSHWLAPAMTLAVFGVYSRLYGEQNPEAVFPTLVLLNVLRTTMTGFAMALSKAIDLFSSLDRYGRFLRLPERTSYVENDVDSDESKKSKYAIEMRKPLTIGYHSKSDPRKYATEVTSSPSSPSSPVSDKFLNGVKEVVKQTDSFATEKLFFVPLLPNIRLNIKKGDLVSVISPTAGGKSLLMKLLLGDADLDPDDFSSQQQQLPIKHNGTVGCCQQTPYVQNSTIRDCILADQEFDVERYARTLVNAVLLEDLKSFSGGDKTVVGENGIVTSGGQKWRISIARLLYANKEINLLDDPLSALDTHVGQAILDNCILGALKNKTRVLITQHMQILPHSDRIIAMHEQEIVFDGTYDEFTKFAKETNYSAGQTVVGQTDRSPTTTSSTIESVDDADKLPVTPSTEVPPPTQEENNEFTLICKNIQHAIDLNEGYFGESRIDLTRTPSSTKFEEQQILREQYDRRGKLIKKEEIQTGSVSWRIYFYYCSCAGLFLTFLVHISFALWRVTHLLSDFWLSIWTEKKGGFGRESYTNEEYLLWFSICACATFVAVLCRQITYTMGLNNVAHKIHAKLLHRLLRAPMLFYETNPQGRIQNRIGSDLNAVDQTVAEELMFTTSLFYLILSQVVTIVVGAVYMLPIVLIIAILFHITRIKYAIALRNVRRLENTFRSPVLSIMNETIAGVTTIRIFDQIPFVTKRHMSALLDLLRCAHCFTRIQEWISYRVTLLGTTVVGVTSFVVVILRVFSNTEGGDVTLGKGVMSLALSYAIALATSLSYFIAVVSQTDATMSSVERIKEYSEDIDQEREVIYRSPKDDNKEQEEMKPAAVAISSSASEPIASEDEEEDKKNKFSITFADPLPKEWPLNHTDGSIEFKNVHFRYRENLPLVLKGINFKINKHEKIGIAARSGQGKSTLLTALFRLAEIEDDGVSKILIDGRDTKTINLTDLRQQIGIIPQDPLLFSGTVLSNLDPFNQCTKEQLYDALNLVGLGDRLGIPSSTSSTTSDKITSSKEEDQQEKADESEAPTGLNTPVPAGGSSFSNGEKQLICLARMLVRKTPILCLDEATSSTDKAIDDKMQSIIRDKFKECTIITIAHRLLTIADYDRVMLLKDGVVAEFDTPFNLLQNPESLFSRMVGVLSQSEGDTIRRIAKEHHEQKSLNK